MSTAFRFDPAELPPECEALRVDVSEFIAGEIAARLWAPNSDFGSHREPPAGALTIGPVEPEDRLDIAEAALSGHAGHIPWGLQAAAVVLIAGMALLIIPQGAANFTPGKNLAGEPRDHLGAVEPGGRSAPLPGAIELGLVQRFGALFRAAQMAGAMEAALALSTRYANDRVQFGRPIAKFQAVQQQMALLAEQAAAASVAVESAAIAVTADRPSAALAIAAAKIRRSRREGRRDCASGARRHRLHARAQPAPPLPAPVVVARRIRHRSPLVARARPRGDGGRR
jgi:hypothetical protein